MKRFIRFLKVEAGFTHIEYSLVGALITTAIVVILTIVGIEVANLYSK